MNAIYFSASDVGVDRSVAEWGVDAAWPDYNNVRQSVANIGPANVDFVRIAAFDTAQPLIDNGNGTFSLTQTSKDFVDLYLERAALAGPNIPLAIVPGGSGEAAYLHPYYEDNIGNVQRINVTNWVRGIKATEEYIHTRPGWQNVQIKAIEPFNEPDFWAVQGNADHNVGGPLLNSVIQQLKTYPEFANTDFEAASTLNSFNAQNWYDLVPNADVGSSHLLAGSLETWVDFIDHVNSDGKTFSNLELHSLGELIAGADHGMHRGSLWAAATRSFGKFMQASDGKQLAYTEDFVHDAAGAVYRAPDGQLYAFAGPLERDYTGSPASFRFVSTDQDVYFNGIRVREFMLPTTNRPIDWGRYGSWNAEGSYADIDLDDTGVPALDGYRWKIVNELDGTVMEVAGGGLNDGANIRSAADTGGLNQLWQITRTRNGYYHLVNANSGKAAEIAGLSLSTGANVQQWGTPDAWGKQWYIESAGRGGFSIRNANSHKFLDADLGNDNIIQWDANGGAQQKWRFVLDNPTDGPVAHYMMQANLNDSAGTNHGAVFGSPAYGVGHDGRRNSAIRLDGVNDYVDLPDSVTASADITIAAWVNWNGGGDWQRVFDFGNDTTTYMFLTPKSGDNTMRFGITEGSSADEQILETAPLPIGEWVHLTLTLGGNTGILYVNGEPQVAGQILLNPSDINATNNYLGKSQWNDPLFNGRLDDLQIFNYALHPSQVVDLVNVADADHDGDVDGADFLLLQRSNPSLIGLWEQKFGQGGGATAAGIPEPQALVLLVLGMATACGVAGRAMKDTPDA